MASLRQRVLGTKTAKKAASVSTPSRPSTSSSAAIQGRELLLAELRRHRLTPAAAEAAAIEFASLALAGGEAKAPSLLRAVLRRLRQGRTDGRPLEVGGQDAEVRVDAAAVAAARSAWAAMRDAEPRDASRALLTALPWAAAADGVAVPVAPPMRGDAGKVCFVVNGVLGPEDCDSIIQRCDSEGWHAASLEYGLSSGDMAGEAVVNVGLRDSDRCVLHDARLAALIWDRLHPLIAAPGSFAPLLPKRVNSCFRCLRYTEGQAGFAKHMDGRSTVDGEISRLTIQLYLNDGFDGGATRLCHQDDSEDTLRGVDVIPRKGMALVFDQSILHKGSPVHRGTKYTARTEVMYSGSDGTSIGDSS
mmetsp:Transcript_34752/g.99795  ORF Transcript_34752/g.99795 Transcript_34752/m.99795 type:complete len:361 (-) Transcript_34752:36-1118(-)